MTIKIGHFANFIVGYFVVIWEAPSEGQMKIFYVSSHQLRESLRELLRELWFSHSRKTPFREWDFSFREWNFKFRELLREYPGTLPDLRSREWPFHSESVFPEIGVVPRLLK